MDEIAHIDKSSDRILNDRHFKLPQATQDEVERHVEIMLWADIIEHSTSQYNNPIFLVKKPDGSFRFVVDFHSLNSIINPITFSHQYISDLINSLRGPKYFSVADLKQRYMNIPLDEGS